jgi:lactaldehyde dehydrogenase/glycolaldehyde dehydrogenase
VELPVLPDCPQTGSRLLTGNTIVIKPSEFTPNNAIAFAKIVDDIGLPRGVFNLVLGRGETVGQELAGNPKVAMVSMTGSVGAGEKIMAAAAKTSPKFVWSWVVKLRLS